MTRGCYVALILSASCGGNAKPITAPKAEAIALVPSVTEQSWYRAMSICGQGPYEIEIPVADAKYGEDFELRVATPRRIAVQAVIVADGADVARRSTVFGRDGQSDDKPDNARCVADAKERLVAARGGSSGGATTTIDVTPGVMVKPPPQQISVTGQLQQERDVEPPSVEVLRFGWRDHDKRAGRIRIRLWSIEPNDLEGVLFGASRIEWRPNVSEAEYAAFLVRQEAERKQREAEWIRRYQEEHRSSATVEIDAKTMAELERLELESQRRRALEAERKRRRELFCASHPEDRDCWGAGGMKVHLELEMRGAERARYCAAHREVDARCWSGQDWGLREAAWRKRVQLATAAPKQPDGPPPDALEETIPPKLSLHAEWRPGYWLWTGTTWTWLGGMWRVPDEDIVAEQTTTAPNAPPPPKVETIPPPPMQTTIWVTGFWQWNGSTWVWVAGSYQARPEVGLSWRPAEWRARGSVHVLVPGGWVRVRAGGR